MNNFAPSICVLSSFLLSFLLFWDDALFDEDLNKNITDQVSQSSREKKN